MPSQIHPIMSILFKENFLTILETTCHEIAYPNPKAKNKTPMIVGFKPCSSFRKSAKKGSIKVNCAKLVKADIDAKIMFLLLNSSLYVMGCDLSFDSIIFDLEICIVPLGSVSTDFDTQGFMKMIIVK